MHFPDSNQGYEPPRCVDEPAIEECGNNGTEVLVISVLLLLVTVLTAAALSDMRSHRIPNWLTFPVMVAGLVYYFYLGGPRGLLFSLAGLMLGFAFLMPFYLIGGTGAGDVKLMAAVGALLGPGGVLWSFLCTALVGGVYAVLLLVTSRYRQETRARYKERLRTFIRTRNLAELKADKTQKAPVLCYGVAIAIGTFLSLLKGAYLW